MGCTLEGSHNIKQYNVFYLYNFDKLLNIILDC